MEIDGRRFMGTLGHSGFHKKLRQSLLPFKEGEFPEERPPFLEKLHADICSGSYFPSAPRGYVVQNKHKGVARIVPVLSYQDICVYYFCIKQLEGEIAINRVPGTFGGWALGNPIRVREEEEHAADDKVGEIGEAYYSWTGCFNPFAWTKNWKEFQRLAYRRAWQSGATGFIAFDIANFYDSINLDLLKRKLRATVSTEKGTVIDLLFVLLTSWNRRFQGYGPKTIGLPQDEFGDCSRLLANFYLQEYDAVMHKVCGDVGGVFLRYADDQLVMTKDAAECERILFEASVESHKIGLNVNSGKVIAFQNREHFNYYWSFDIMGNLNDKHDRESVNASAKVFVARLEAEKKGLDTREWRKAMVLRRFATIGVNKISEPIRAMIVDELIAPDAVARSSSWLLNRLVADLKESERKRLQETVDNLIPTIAFNSFYLNLQKCPGLVMEERRKCLIAQRLRELSYDSTS